mgnify:CR=1 FL=1
MADLAKIVEDLSALSVLEAAELSKMLEEKWGVSAAAPVAVAAVGGAQRRGKTGGKSKAGEESEEGFHGVEDETGGATVEGGWPDPGAGWLALPKPEQRCVADR